MKSFRERCWELRHLLVPTLLVLLLAVLVLLALLQVARHSAYATSPWPSRASSLGQVEGFLPQRLHRVSQDVTTVKKVVPLFSFRSLDKEELPQEQGKTLDLDEETINAIVDIAVKRLLKLGVIKPGDGVDPVPVEPGAVANGKKVGVKEAPEVLELRNNCLSCHGSKTPKGKLSLFDEKGQLRLSQLTREQRWTVWDRTARAGDDDERMPPAPRQPLSAAGQAWLRKLARQ